MLRRVLGLLAIAVIAAVALAGCGGGDGGIFGGSTGHSLSGQITVLHNTSSLVGCVSCYVGDSCKGEGGYSDMRQGAQVVVKDGSGAVLAVGALGPGEVPGVAGQKGLDCRFEFSVADIPVEEFYSIEVSHRGGMTYSYDELEALNWTVSLSLGS